MLTVFIIMLVFAAVVARQFTKSMTTAIGLVTILWIAIGSWFLGASMTVFFWMLVLR